MAVQVQSEYEEQQRSHEQVVGQSSNMLAQFNDLQARSGHQHQLPYSSAAIIKLQHKLPCTCRASLHIAGTLAEAVLTQYIPGWQLADCDKHKLSCALLSDA